MAYISGTETSVKVIVKKKHQSRDRILATAIHTQGDLDWKWFRLAGPGLAPTGGLCPGQRSHVHKKGNLPMERRQKPG